MRSAPRSHWTAPRIQRIGWETRSSGLIPRESSASLSTWSEGVHIGDGAAFPHGRLMGAPFRGCIADAKIRSLCWYFRYHSQVKIGATILPMQSQLIGSGDYGRSDGFLADGHQRSPGSGCDYVSRDGNARGPLSHDRSRAKTRPDVQRTGPVPAANARGRAAIGANESPFIAESESGVDSFARRVIPPFR
jgi:hypothetical protein